MLDPPGLVLATREASSLVAMAVVHPQVSLGGMKSMYGFAGPQLERSTISSTPVKDRGDLFQKRHA
jgi:hypothetical protein